MQFKNVAQPTKIIDPLLWAIKHKNTRIQADSVFILVCGKQPNQQTPGGRDNILKYAKTHLGKFQFFMAEKVFELLGKDKTIDLLSIEEKLSSYCDCVIVVLESESTFSELGAFSIKDELARILLVINDVEHIERSSFINLGPLAKVNRKSLFRPVIHVDLRKILSAIPDLTDRLSKIEKHNRKLIDLSTFDAFENKQENRKFRMLLLLDLITFFHPVKYSEIIDILKLCYGDQDYNISFDIHLLNALGLAYMIGEYYVRPPQGTRLFLSYPSIIEMSLRSAIVNHYHKYYRERPFVLVKKMDDNYAK